MCPVQAAGPPQSDACSEADRQAIAERPNHADLYYRLGLLLKNRGQIEEAVDAFQHAVAINPAYMKALIKLGLALKEVGRTDEAILFQQILTKHKIRTFHAHAA